MMKGDRHEKDGGSTMRQPVEHMRQAVEQRWGVRAGSLSDMSEHPSRVMSHRQ